MKNIAFLLIIYIIESQLVFSQSAYFVTHFSNEDYGAGSQNWSIDTDDPGFICVANNDGLLIFDGAHWKLYSVPDQTIIRSVLVSRDKRIYTGSYEDFGYWEKDSTHDLSYHSLKPSQKNSFHNDEIWRIIECNGKIYFQSFSALFVYDHHSVKPISIPSVVIFLLKADNRMFVQSINGRLYELINDSLEPLNTGNALLKTEVKAVLPYKDGTFLIGTSSKGVFQYDGKHIRPWNVPANNALKRFQINNGIISGDRIIFGTIVKGIFVLDFNGRICFHLHNENALQNNTVLSLCTDYQGGIWAGLDKGIDHISFKTALEPYNESREQLGAVYTAALMGNTLYLGTNRGIYTYSEENKSDRFRYTGFLNNSQGQVWELKNIDGTLFCGHTNGTYIIKDQKLIKISDVSGGFAIEKYIRDGKEYLLQSTYAALVLYKRNRDLWEYCLQFKGFIEPSRFLEIDHLNNIWIGHAVKGLYRLRLSETMDSVAGLTCYGKKDGLPSDFNIRVFKIEDRIIFATGKSLFTYDDLNNEIIPYTVLNKQLNGFENATNIVNIGNDRYCLIRNDDIAVFEIKDNKASQLIRFFLPLYKLKMVNGYENVVCLNRERSIICLDEGFALFSNNFLSSPDSEEAKLIFREVKCINTAGEKRNIESLKTPFTLKHAWNSLFISFTYTSHHISAKRFQYKLEPFDPDWSNWTEKAEVLYTRLPRGNYIFMVRTISPAGVVTDPVSLQFRIKPAFYASPLSFVLYGILLVTVIMIAFVILHKRFLNQKEKIKREAMNKLLQEKQRGEQEIVKLQNQNLQSEISHKNIQLADSTMAIIKKNELLIEIKNELDRQKKRLGNNYPVNFLDKIFSLINKNITDDNDWKVFEELFDQAHADFFKRLKSSFPELTQSDLKLCAYLRLNLTSKEIAPLLNISYRGVETRRYRLRRRLLLDSDENLVGFILQF